MNSLGIAMKHRRLLPIGLAVVLVSIFATEPIIFSNPFAFAQITITPDKNVLSIDSAAPTLRKINPDTGATISSVEISLDGTFPVGLVVKGGTGLAFNPVDGKLYALLKVSDAPGDQGGKDRHLAIIDPQTGIATLVGDTGVPKIASLTFNPGTLFGVRLEPMGGPTNLSTISIVDGSVTNLCLLVTGTGSGLAFNPNDGLLYYITDSTFQRIDDFTADPCVVTTIATPPDLDPNALAFDAAEDKFLLDNFITPLFELLSITAAGDVTFIANLDQFNRGLTIIDKTDTDGDGVTISDGDCNDMDSTIFPGAPELDDGKDNDCDTVVDNGLDTDGDGFTPIFGGDCDDSDVNINPDAIEVPGNSIDENCDGFDTGIINLQFFASLDGSQEVPQVGTIATGSARFALNQAGDGLEFEILLENLDLDGNQTPDASDDVTGAHIHKSPVGVNGEIVVGFISPDTVGDQNNPLLIDAVNGSITGTITSQGLTGSLNGQPLSALLDEIIAENTYVNIHTNAHLGGEIRGQIQPCLPPSSGDWVIMISCDLVESATAPANVIVMSNSKLTIKSGDTLTVPSGFNITIQSGSGVLIKSGGTLQVNS